MKRCCRCKKQKPVTDFGNDRHSRDGLALTCRACCSIQKRASHKKLSQNAEWLVHRKSIVRKSVEKWRLNHPEANKSAAMDWYLSEGGRRWYLNRNMRRYGSTAEQYLALLEKQDGVCAICHQEETTKTKHGYTRPLHIDHDHQSGKIRGLLCMQCNSAIGMLKESRQLFDAAANYCEGINCDDIDATRLAGVCS